MRFERTDYHIHTKWSNDVGDDGPSFEDYAEIALNNQLNICFLDHYELYYLKKDKSYPFRKDRINQYIEEIDKVKENYEFVKSGLEIDFYPEKKSEIKEFLDDYETEIDFIAGTIHEIEYEWPITLRNKVLELKEKKSIDDIITQYINLTRQLIESNLFRNICHIDTIFRYINNNDILPEKPMKHYENQILNLGKLCIKNGINIEYNLSGLRYSRNQPFPSNSTTIQLKKSGANFYVGSDSHSLIHFKNSIEKVKEGYNFIESIE